MEFVIRIQYLFIMVVFFNSFSGAVRIGQYFEYISKGVVIGGFGDEKVLGIEEDYKRDVDVDSGDEVVVYKVYVLLNVGNVFERDDCFQIDVLVKLIKKFFCGFWISIFDLK